MQIVLASNNENKLKEFKAILEPLGYEIVSLKDAGVNSDPEETGSSYMENAFLKANAAYEILHAPVIGDDSGLEVDMLNGEPGLYTKRFAEPGKHCEKILRLLKGIPQEHRGARLKCALCYIDKNGNAITTEGVCYGIISNKVRGDNPTYPYNILLVGNKTLAELSDSERNKSTHRANALREFIKIMNARSE